MKTKVALGPVNRTRFLEAFAQSGILEEAARVAGVARQSHYVWLKDPEYQRRFAEANERAAERLEAELHRRLYEGTEETVVYQGEVCYQRDEAGNITNKPLIVRRKSDILLMFALKGAKPEKYRENVKADINHTGQLAVTHRIELTRLNDAALDQLEAMFRLPAPDGGGGSIDAEADEE